MRDWRPFEISHCGFGISASPCDVKVEIRPVELAECAKSPAALFVKMIVSLPNFAV